MKRFVAQRIGWIFGFAGVLATVFTASAAEKPVAERPPANQAAAGKPQVDKAADERNQRFLRIERDAAEHPLALETAIIRFESDAPERKGVVVDLVGAVHIGERSYYEKLNKQFEGYEAVLYEMVAPEGTRIPKGAKPTGILSSLQNGMKDLLGLEHQLQLIDYTKKNLVHADMSPDDFAKSMESRGESMTSMMMRMLAAGLARQDAADSAGKSSDFEILMALFDRNRAVRLKQLVAEQFVDLETLVAGINGPDGSTILTERNKVALAKLEKQLAHGRKRVAIFYGVGHLPDMADHLAADFHLHQTDVQWITAWNLTADAKPSKAAQNGKAPAGGK